MKIDVGRLPYFDKKKFYGKPFFNISRGLSYRASDIFGNNNVPQQQQFYYSPVQPQRQVYYPQALTPSQPTYRAPQRRILRYVKQQPDYKELPKLENEQVLKPYNPFKDEEKKEEKNNDDGWVDIGSEIYKSQKLI